MSKQVDSAMATTDAFLETFNDGDAVGHSKTLAYPHIRLASGHVRIWDTIEQAVQAMERAIAALRGSGWVHSVWDHRNVIHDGDGKVHLDVQFHAVPSRRLGHRRFSGRLRDRRAGRPVAHPVPVELCALKGCRLAVQLNRYCRTYVLE